MWKQRDSSQDLPDSLAERLEKARERALSEMSDAELQDRIKELQGM
jgi:DNA-binding ferritin-like protein